MSSPTTCIPSPKVLPGTTGSGSWMMTVGLGTTITGLGAAPTVTRTGGSAFGVFATISRAPPSPHRPPPFAAPTGGGADGADQEEGEDSQDWPFPPPGHCPELAPSPPEPT